MRGGGGIDESAVDKLTGAIKSMTLADKPTVVEIIKEMLIFQPTATLTDVRISASPTMWEISLVNIKGNVNMRNYLELLGAGSAGTKPRELVVKPGGGKIGVTGTALTVTFKVAKSEIKNE